MDRDRLSTVHVKGGSELTKTVEGRKWMCSMETASDNEMGVKTGKEKAGSRQEP